MKGLAGGFGLIAMLAVFGIWTMMSVSEDGSGTPIALAFGKPSEGQIEMQVVVGVVMASRDQMRKKDKRIRTLPEWIRDHFDLRDSSDNKLEFRRLNNSLRIRPGEVPGTHEFLMTTKLNVGESYEFDYIPEVDKGKKFHHTFTAPAAAEKVRQYPFKPI